MDIAIQLIVQAGALGLCAYMIHTFGQRLDRVMGAMYKLAQRLEITLDVLLTEEQRSTVNLRVLEKEREQGRE